MEGYAVDSYSRTLYLKEDLASNTRRIDDGNSQNRHALCDEMWCHCWPHTTRAVVRTGTSSGMVGRSHVRWLVGGLEVPCVYNCWKWEATSEPHMVKETWNKPPFTLIKLSYLAFPFLLYCILFEYESKVVWLKIRNASMLCYRLTRI